MNKELEKANELYMKSKAVWGISRALRRRHLQDALVIYTSQLGKIPRTEVPSLYKNIGMAHYRMANVVDAKFELDLAIYHYSEAVGALAKSWMGKPLDMRESMWGERLVEVVEDCFDEACRALEHDPALTAADGNGFRKLYLLDRVRKSIPPHHEVDQFRLRFHLVKARYCYYSGVEEMGNVDFKKALAYVEHTREEMEHAKTYLHLEDQEEMKTLLEQIDRDSESLRMSVESVKLRFQADKIYEDVLSKSSAVNFEMAWDVLDMYKAAGLCCREVEIENEAIAVSRQGRMFDKIFKIKEKANQYYRSAFTLASGLPRGHMSSSPWFQECKDAIKRFQDETVKEEEEKKRKEREPYLQKMTNTLQELNQIHKLEDPYKLLRFIYSKHPPKLETPFTYDEKSVNAQNIKATLMKAITHYHPDKQVRHPMEWRILSEEITKCLTVRYERLK